MKAEKPTITCICEKTEIVLAEKGLNARVAGS
jgi:hypothetical protein